jgi:hypothetical protein
MFSSSFTLCNARTSNVKGFEHKKDKLLLHDSRMELLYCGSNLEYLVVI